MSRASASRPCFWCRSTLRYVADWLICSRFSFVWMSGFACLLALSSFVTRRQRKGSSTNAWIVIKLLADHVYVSTQFNQGWRQGNLCPLCQVWYALLKPI
ncbi:hypothetical protein ZEAMMB73_Zm00001d010560 [Zea mays]|uniref:Uncharacterized protein n=1 Tax=Zea mays TaxID=4577 RepID=A0A1D6FRY8_MAIZE|nr:hypothetical protein ZEAMMB73_Zm00001d010560 [Zea mays]